MRLLVTGSSGFIGQRVVRQLEQVADCEVVTCGRSEQANDIAVTEHQVVDLLAPGEPAALIGRVSPTHLLHLAWNATPGQFWTAPDNLDWAAASLALYRAFLDRGGARAVFAGSCAEYDWTAGNFLSESSPTAPATLYGAIKDATRRAVCASAQHLGGSLAWGRVFWPYGPGEPTGRLVSGLAHALAAGEPIVIRQGPLVRDFIHIDDVAGAFVAALSSDYCGPFNVGSGEPVTIASIANMIGLAAGRNELVTFETAAASDQAPPFVVADTRTLRQLIGFTPAIRLDQGLGEYYEAVAARIGAPVA